jgi:hypothetical protein
MEADVSIPLPEEVLAILRWRWLACRGYGLISCPGWLRAGKGLAEPTADTREIFGEPRRVTARVESVAATIGGGKGRLAGAARSWPHEGPSPLSCGCGGACGHPPERSICPR